MTSKQSRKLIDKAWNKGFLWGGLFMFVLFSYAVYVYALAGNACIL